MPRRRAGQDLPSWIGAHVRHAGRTSRAVPPIWVPDNLKSGVTTANRYEPEINRTYAELARHYGAVVIPARVATPTDKPQVEVSVQIAQRWVLAALRHRTFFTLADLNAAIRERVDAINDRPMKLTGVSRRALFDADSIGPRSSPCRARATSWRNGSRVASTSIITWRWITTSTACRISSCTRGSRRVSRRRPSKCSAKGRRVASHVRLTGRGRFSTQLDHMPRAHRAHAEWTPSRLIAWAEQSGPATGRVVAGILARPAASRARVPRVPGADATGPAPWRRSTRSRLSPRRAAALLSLSHRRTHSHQPAGPAPARGSRPCPSRADARESARRDLLRGDLC